MNSYRRFRQLNSSTANKSALSEKLEPGEVFYLLEAIEKEALVEASGIPGVVTIYFDHRAGKLRAQADDGTHGLANVAFPNSLRTKEGAKYKVASLVWNGKNYRASGDITPFEEEEEELDWDSLVIEADKLLEELINESGNEDYDDSDGYWYTTSQWCNRYLYYTNCLTDYSALEDLCKEYSKKLPDCSFYVYQDSDEEDEPISEIGYILGQE